MAEHDEGQRIGARRDAAAAIGDDPRLVEGADRGEFGAQRGAGRKAPVAGSISAAAGTLTLFAIRPGRPYTVPPVPVCCAAESALIVQVAGSPMAPSTASLPTISLRSSRTVKRAGASGRAGPVSTARPSRAHF